MLKITGCPNGLKWLEMKEWNRSGGITANRRASVEMSTGKRQALYRAFKVNEWSFI